MMLIKRFMTNLLLLIVLLMCPGQVIGSETVRVRVMHKYHPTSVTVWTDSDPDRRTITLESNLPLKIVPRQTVTVKYAEGEEPRSYRGDLVIDRGSEELLLVNNVPVEDYVSSVVLSELGWKHPEAMRAQAVLARTWVERNLRPKEKYDFGDLTNSQVYKGEFPQSEKTRLYLGRTVSEILQYNYVPIEVLYYGACSERSFSAFEVWGRSHIPYLKARELPDVLRDSIRTNHWQRTLVKSLVDQVFVENNIPGNHFDYRMERHQNRQGVLVNGRWFAIDEFRLKVNRRLGWNTIRSNDFSIENMGDNIILRGMGFGHLVGMCQKEADVLARNGWSYRQILDLFYPGTNLGSKADQD
jgi:stage II sporulation protein D